LYFVPKSLNRVVVPVVAAATVLAIAYAGASATAPNADAAPATPTAASPLVVNLAGGSGTLDPAQACGSFDVGFDGNIYSTLTAYGHKKGPAGTEQVDPGKIIPYFATSWKISKDGRVYTFKLPKGVTFPSGHPMDAKAVKDSFDRNIKTGGCGAYFIEDGLFTPPLIKSVTAPNATTVVIRLNRADLNALQDWAQPGAAIVDPGLVEANGGVKKGVVNKWMQGHAAGNGPFVLQSYNPANQAVLVSNPHFFGPKPASKKIIVNFIGNDSTLLLQARSGQADITLGLSKQAAISLKGDNCCRLIVSPTTQSLQILMPTGKDHAPFDNVAFRTALTYAVPYTDILKKVALGYGQLFYGPFAPLFPQYVASQEKPRTFDLNRAKQLISQSGVSTPVNVEMIINGDVPVDEQLATIVQGIWGQIGVNMKITKLATSDFETRINKRDYQLAITQDGPGVIEAGYYLGYDMQCGVAYNAAGICIPAADKWLAKARAEANPAKRLADYRKIIPLWRAASPKIPVYADEYISVLNKRVKHYFYSHEMDMRTWAK
jgi:peptide/nickel transport system substrate-binding protein